MKFVDVGAMVLPLFLAFATLPASAQQRQYRYQCEQGKSFLAEYSTDSARLTLDSGETVTLASVVAASGARYSNEEMTLHTKGNEAFIEQGDQQLYRNCVGQLTGQTGQAGQAGQAAPVQPVQGLW